jgi:hypothetical protein
MSEAEKLWMEHRRSKMSLQEQLDYFGKLSAQMPLASLRVVYAKAGTLAAAAALKDRSGVVDHKLYWASCDSDEEASFLVAVLNSETLRAKIAPFQSRGQWGARDFDKLLIGGVPDFDSKQTLHKEIARAGEIASRLAERVELPESIHFVRARQVIRRALHEHGIAQKIDKLVEKVLAD